MTNRFVLLLAFALFAGCLGHGAAAPPPQAEPFAASPSALVLTGCVSLQAAVPYPGPTAPGARPDGWPAAPSTMPTTFVGVRALRCQRLSLGPFERGPVHLAFAWHDNAQAPATCGGDGPKANVLTALWTDDGDLAAYLQGRLGLPAHQVPFDEGADGAWRSWSWGPAGNASTLGVLDGGQREHKGDSFHAFWAAGGGVGRLAFNATAASDVPDRPARGTLAGDFVGTGRWQEEVEAAGTLQRFTGTDCSGGTA